MHPIPTAAHTHSSSSTFRDQKEICKYPGRHSHQPNPPSQSPHHKSHTHAMQSVPTQNTYIPPSYTPSCVPAIPAGRSPPCTMLTRHATIGLQNGLWSRSQSAAYVLTTSFAHDAVLSNRGGPCPWRMDYAQYAGNRTVYASGEGFCKEM